MIKCRIILFLLLYCSVASAQDTVKHVHHRADSAFFSDRSTPQQSDYLESFEQVFQTLNKAPLLTSSFLNLDNIQHDLVENDSAVIFLKERMTHRYRFRDLSSLQVYNTLLDKLAATTKAYEDNLDDYGTKLEGLKKEIASLRKDTLIGHIFRDTALRAAFTPQLQQLRSKWRRADSLVKSNSAIINALKARVTSNAITIADLLFEVDAATDELSDNAFGKEQPYLWEQAPATAGGPTPQELDATNAGEKKLARYYFANAGSARLWLLVTWAIYFYWVWFNFRSMKRLGKLSSIDDFHFRYITPVPVIASLLFILSLAPLFDQRAPAVYIEYTQFALMVVLAIAFYRQLPRHYFVLWLIFIILALLQYITGTRHLLATYSGRWVALAMNTAAVVLAAYFFFHSKDEPGRSRFVRLAVGIYLLLNLAAIGCNLSGRVTLSQIAGTTAFFALSSAIALAVFKQLAIETFLLQIQGSRMRKDYPVQFEFAGIARSLGRFLIIFAVALWLIIVTTSLNVFDTLSDRFTDLFTAPRRIGNFPFTLSGIALFLGIIWIANFFQKYIAYFFGDTGDDASIDDRGQRSRLLVTRLILLIGGFLLAVAASGLPIDKITFVLGALGVGIGLGLQSIVNNFVSGIIIIFDRPMRIGDTVEIGDRKGRVREISIRSSTLLTEEGAEVIIPNGDVLSHNIVNWTLSNNQVRSALAFSLDKATYTNDIQPEIKELIKAVPKVFLRREPEVVLENINSKLVGMKVYFWCTDINSASATTAQVREAIYNYLDRKGITML